MKGMNDMDKTKVWFINGAGRGMGTTIAKAALTAGHKVVATGRNPDAVVRAIGDSENVMVVPLDVCEPADAHAAVKAAIDEAQPPQRFIAGADAIDIAEQKIANLQLEINAYRDLSKSMAYDN
ncbi:hypothetical protein BK124_03840 [Paenibacillus amylolyticus]|uniref:SDR family NAD(P)-dependent oxidoreductase n=1 Tax=Paenibacillus amylolyticus TaxID=1451 RepID=UPI00096F28D6|nr:SDR family NAD(P)-dependent oxidoreductase [Paenibacillus amylolyticus]OMF01788.1 hypothetical protein BK124_03840 [Paenibacillus amylolyticus]